MRVEVEELVSFPIYLLARDCREAYRLDSEKALHWVESIDVENDEYKAWDSTGTILRLEAFGIGRFRSGSLRVTATALKEDADRFADVIGNAVKRDWVSWHLTNSKTSAV